MARTRENLEFAERLKWALKRQAKPTDSPAFLATQFNLMYAGESISNQAAQKWLVGDNKPAADKIATLALMLDVSVEWLRFGFGDPQAKKTQIAEPVATYQTPANVEAQLLARFRRLTPQQQNLMLDWLESMR